MEESIFILGPGSDHDTQPNGKRVFAESWGIASRHCAKSVIRVGARRRELEPRGYKMGGAGWERCKLSAARYYAGVVHPLFFQRNGEAGGTSFQRRESYLAGKKKTGKAVKVSSDGGSLCVETTKGARQFQKKENHRGENENSPTEFGETLESGVEVGAKSSLKEGKESSGENVRPK